MNSRHRVNGTNCIIAIITALLFGFFALYNLAHGEITAFLIFAGLFLLFAYTATQEGAVVAITPSYVQLSKRGRIRLSYEWGQIAEVGVAGLKLFEGAWDNIGSLLGADIFDRVSKAKRGKKRKNGAKYIYFSTRKMTDEEIFDMCLRWPPKDKIYVQYDHELLCSIQAIWSREIKLYNSKEIEMP